MARKPRKKPDNPGKTPGKAPGTLVVQPHGGAIKTGGNPGNAGGTGRPREAMRRELFDAIADGNVGPSLVRDIAAGRPVQRTRFSVIALAPHVKCAACGSPEIVPKDLENAPFVEIAAEVSASVRDRLAALDVALRYSVGPMATLTVQAVRERMTATLDIIQQNTTAEQFEVIAKQSEPLWR